MGQQNRDSKFRDRYGVVILAMTRNGERIKGNLGTISLAAGDTLLLEARPAFVSRLRYNKDFLLVNDLEAETPRHEGAWLAWAILVAMVVAAGAGLTDMLNASLIGEGFMIVTGCCSLNQTEKSLYLCVLVTITPSFTLGMARQKNRC